jgi:lipid II:glycine glycyltransferase (peptidoglycan interpeptide bridge formation enzyme)
MELVHNHPEAHLLQSAAWGELKSSFGWHVERVQNNNSGAQILFRALPLGLSIAYIPKGPLGPWLPELLPEIDKICRSHNAILLKIEPDHDELADQTQSLREFGFHLSAHSIQPRRTLVVDLQGTEEEILSRMNQKTRYNVRLAGRKAVHVRPWRDFGLLAQMMKETGERDSFGVHSGEYYQRAFELFDKDNAVELLVAEFENVPLAAAMVFATGTRSWYLYGASTRQERNRMPTYLLQWEAMLWAREQGCQEYDLWGVPDFSLDELEANFQTSRGELWGVYRFKRGFGGKLRRSTGAWDRPYQKLLYALYRLFIPLFWK